MSSSSRRLGLIGFGQFGRFAARHLRDHFTVLVTDRADLRRQAEALEVEWASLGEAAASPVVVVAVPLTAMAGIFEEMRPHLQPGALVVDVGSVKVLPLRWMRERLPDEVELLGSHPLFGPQSAADGLAGHRIVLCPGRTSRLDEVRAFLERLGLVVIVTDADSHDQQIARSQALAQFVGRALAGMQLERPEVRTPAFDRLLEAAAIVGDDSWELFASIQGLNPHATFLRRRLLDELGRLETRLAAEADDSGAGTGHGG